MMRNDVCLFMAMALFGAAGCKQKDETPKNHLECPSDPAPIKAYSGGGSIVLPNAFSPNNDGINDGLRVVQTNSTTLRSMVMRIVAADGTLLATITKPADYWDGYNHSTGKFYPAGKYRVDYGFVLHGGSGPDVVANGNTCVKLYGSDSSGCLIRQGNPNEDVFEDQIDPATSNAIYTTAEQICP